MYALLPASSRSASRSADKGKDRCGKVGRERGHVQAADAPRCCNCSKTGAPQRPRDPAARCCRQPTGAELHSAQVEGSHRNQWPAAGRHSSRRAIPAQLAPCQSRTAAGRQLQAGPHAVGAAVAQASLQAGWPSAGPQRFWPAAAAGWGAGPGLRAAGVLSEQAPVLPAALWHPASAAAGPPASSRCPPRCRCRCPGRRRAAASMRQRRLGGWGQARCGAAWTAAHCWAAQEERRWLPLKAKTCAARLSCCRRCRWPLPARLERLEAFLAGRARRVLPVRRPWRRMLRRTRLSRQLRRSPSKLRGEG